MGDIAVTPQVIARNGIGRFISECSLAAATTIKEIINDGQELSIALAPVGHKADPRTPTLQAAMYSRQISRTSGVWGNDARHALPIELGAGAHVIMGSPYLSFFWDNAGRQWVPGLYGTPDFVNHPGNAAQPYLRPAYEVMMSRAMSIADGNYPG